MEDETAELGEIVVTDDRRRPQTGLQKFIATVNKHGGPARSSHFAVEITHSGIAADWSESLMYLCESASLPGLSFATDDTYAPYGFGQIQRMPWNVMFDGTMQLTFIGDNAGFVRQTFAAWVNSISAFNGHSQHNTTEDGRRHFTMSYPDTYRGAVRIHTYDVTGKRSSTYTLHNAYPVALSPVQLSMGDTGYMRIPVTFSYSHWSVNHASINNAAEGTDSEFHDTLPVIQNAFTRRSVFDRVRDEVGNRIETDLNNVLNNVRQQVPPALQSVYARAIPLLGGLSDFRF